MCSGLFHLNKIKLNNDYSFQNLDEMKTLVINPYMFTNIKIIQFNDVAFTFDNNEDFI